MLCWAAGVAKAAGCCAGLLGCWPAAATLVNAAACMFPGIGSATLTGALITGGCNRCSHQHIQPIAAPLETPEAKLSGNIDNL